MEGKETERIMTDKRQLLPTQQELDELMEMLREAMFPMVYGNDRVDQTGDSSEEKSDETQEQTVRLLTRLVSKVLIACRQQTPDEAWEEAEKIAREFLCQLPEISQLLNTDVDAIAANDPAVGSRLEVICCYPAITVMLHFRVAHALHVIGLPLLPRMLTERAHSMTGIDIHPAAQIGASFSIDHGTGIVVGATCIIGHHVMLYQGVTLGAKNFHHDADGRLLDHPRHPIIEDNVTIYSNTSVLGRVRIGHDSVIGGNLWITHDVEPHSVIRQSKPVKQIGFSDGAGI